MRKFWKPLLAILVFCFMQVLAGGVFLLIKGVNATNETGLHPAILALALILSDLAAVAILYAMDMIKPKALKVKGLKWKHASLALVGAILGVIATDLLSEQLTLPDLMEMEFRGLSHSFWGILAICIIGPVAEELVFREGIAGYLVRHGAHRWTAIFFSALAFSIIHLNPAQMPFAFIMGIIFGIIYVKMGSIVLTSFIHILNNSLAVLEMNLLGDRAEEITYADLLGGTSVVYAYIVVCTILSILFLRQFWLQYHRDHHYRDEE